MFLKRFCSVLICLLTLCQLTLSAQSRLGIYLGAGATWYYGDMNDRIITHPKLFRTYFNGGLVYRLTAKTDLQLNLLYGKIVGADSLAIQEFNRKRNLNFESPLMSAELMVNFRFLGLPESGFRRINPYLIAGAGYLKFNPSGEYNGQRIDLQPLGTEGQFINGTGYPKPYELTTFIFPLGIGVEIPLSKSFRLRVEYANHFTMTDYLDDVSTKYADSTLLANTPKGVQATTMASHLTAGYPNEGYGRGNPQQRDSYSTLGISLLYTPVKGAFGNRGNGIRRGGVIGKKKKTRPHCPAYQ